MYNPTVDPNAEAAIIEFLTNIYSSFSYMDAKTIQKNIKLSVDYNTPPSYKAIDKNLALYLLNNISFITLLLIANEEFRDMFKEAVCIEIALEQKNDVLFSKQTRQEMNGDFQLLEPRDNWTISFSSYSEKIYKEINKLTCESFNEIAEYDDIFDSLVDKLDDLGKIDIGFCVSNFMYLIRAFQENSLFRTYVINAIDNLHTITLDTDF
ncbi:MAG: hypothetical protein MJ105_06950 [Lachnospiraceae bacterium]|nr:hypothetical protein [Lachnospiraceae bacterium]